MGAVLGAALLTSDSGWLIGAGASLLVLNVLNDPVGWWRHVRTGTRLETPVRAEFAEPGACSVELRSTGGRSIDVIKQLRETTGVGLAEAKSKVQAVPVVIAEGLSAESAKRVRQQVELAGATAVIVMQVE